MKYTAPNDLPLLEALALLSPKSSKNTLRSWIKEGRVKVNELMAKNASLIVLKDQVVSVGQRKKIIAPGIPILYEDDDLVIVDKPTGLLSVATAFEKGETLHALLKAHFRPRKVFVVHRLDQDTSGVIVFALNQKTFERLKELFEAHEIERSYTAVIEGQFLSASGTWQSYQYEDKQYHVHETEDETRGRVAITHYHTVATTKRYSWLTLAIGNRAQKPNPRPLPICRSSRCWGQEVRSADESPKTVMPPCASPCLSTPLLQKITSLRISRSRRILPTHAISASIRSRTCTKSLLDRIFRPDGNHNRHIFRHYRLCTMGIFKT